MRLDEEYRLSEYVDLGRLDDNEKVHIVRNKVNGVIGVRKYIALDLEEIYLFLKENPNPYIPKIYECIQTNTNLIVIEEYLSGKNLEEILKEKNFSEKDAADIIICLCNALYPLHNAKMPVICRDLKAENVILTNEGEVKLIDFDIARIYQPGKSKDTVMMGTQGYAAPEQFGFGQTDARTDIYALGVLLNYMLVRDFPMEKLTEGKFKTIVLKCTKINPEDRYQNVDELKADICNAAEIPCSSMDSDKNKFYCAQSCKKNQAGEIPFYKIPGFRTGKIWKMVVAVIGYALTTVTAWSLEAHDANGKPLPQSELTLERLVVWLSQIVFIFFVCDYRGMRRKIPFANSEIRFIRICVYVAAEILFLFAAAIICVTLEAVLF